MTLETNHFVRFIKRPEGAPTPDIFTTEAAALAPLNAGEFRVRNALISMDPALVSRMRPESNYAESVNPGEVMHAYAVGQVVESKNPDAKVGEVRLGRFDMQEFSTQTDAAETRVINLGIAAPEHYLSVVGITGATAYFVLQDICEPKAGEVMVISAAASSVGRVAAQLAKAQGVTLVGIVSTDEKAKALVAEGVYDAATSYRGKSIEELSADIGALCPNGIDIYFDNTSGDISESLMDHYNDFARIAVIGRLGIAHITDTTQDVGRRDANIMLAHRIKKQGFVLLDYNDRMMEAAFSLARMVKDGSLQADIDIANGVDALAPSFFRMLRGENTGKQLVRVGTIEEAADPANRKVGQLLTKPGPIGGLALTLLKRRGAKG